MAYELIRERIFQELLHALKYGKNGLAIYVAPLNSRRPPLSALTESTRVADHCSSVMALLPDGARALTIKVIKSRHGDGFAELTESEA